MTDFPPGSHFLPCYLLPLGGPLPSLSILAGCQSVPFLLTRSQGAGLDVETLRKGVVLLSTVETLRATWLNSAPDAELCRPGMVPEHPTQACQPCNTTHLRGAAKSHLPHNETSTDICFPFHLVHILTSAAVSGRGKNTQERIAQVYKELTT